MVTHWRRLSLGFLYGFCLIVVMAYFRYTIPVFVDLHLPCRANQCIKTSSYWGCQGVEEWSIHFKEIFSKNISSIENGSRNMTNCSAKFKNTFRENLEIVQNYGTKPEANVMEFLSLDAISLKYRETACDAPKKSYPVIVTAASSNHFLESQGLIQNLHENVFPIYRNMKLVYYDVGLNKKQRQSLEKHCGCQVRDFPFEKFPKYVRNLRNYSFKPLLFMLALNDFDFIMWLDASIRMTGKGLQKLFNDSIATGFHITYESKWLVVETGGKKTFDFLKEEPCLYSYHEMESGWLLIVRSSFILQGIMKPWVSCALHPGCMVHLGDRWVQCRIRKYHSCHRFDQTIINIILRRLFSENSKYLQIDKSTGQSRRLHEVNYFKD